MKTKLWKIALPLLLAFFAIGVLYLSIERPNPQRQRLAESIKGSEQAYRDYLGSDYETAKRALLDLTRFLDQMTAESPDPHRNPYRTDAMICWVRLAKLAEGNDSAEQREYMREAMARCETLGWADCSEQNLRRQVDRMDVTLAQQLDYSRARN